jgi:hypothetical protein
MNYVPELSRTEFTYLKFFYDIHFLKFSVGRVLMIASPSGKRFKVYMRYNVRGSDGSNIGQTFQKTSTLIKAKVHVHFPKVGFHATNSND